ncbi:YfaP family protein [Paludisphaera borealis]|uniref:DUF2135 domain-containing protein n=1 Tax=Paludisphaera borealis TaxID=1387353 RepID=A0A1U7CVH3_9BACT|nr:hypothetical protein [Paludisphaera borealis]APW62944.1 hypothetical protein BSF38_04500 [Paludisphaera borealis]
MSTSPTGEPSAPIKTPDPVPIAYAPRRSPRVIRAAEPLRDEPTGTWFDGFWTAESLKGWAGSLSLHTVLLTCLGLWYLAPPLRKAVSFDSRLGGSVNGVPEGVTLEGGLNTPEDVQGMPENLFEAPLEASIELAQPPMEPTISLGRGAKPSAGGGRPNDNAGAGDGDGFGLARFGDGGEFVRGVAVKVGDPQFTLIWDTDADLDLHVIEPGGKEIFWEEPKGKQGGELDVDNTKGFGPENIYWLVESQGPGSTKVRGPGPPGQYRWFVAYWGGFGGIPKVTKWQVRIKHAGKLTIERGKFRALNERSRLYSLTVEPAAGSAEATDADAAPPARAEQP